jgi:hypothetical protein
VNENHTSSSNQLAEHAFASADCVAPTVVASVGVQAAIFIAIGSAIAPAQSSFAGACAATVAMLARASIKDVNIFCYYSGGSFWYFKKKRISWIKKHNFAA